MTLRDRMLEVLKVAGKPLCDDCVWEPAGMKSRQQANARGRQLESMGLIRRGLGTCSECGKHKTVSAPTGVEIPIMQEPSSAEDTPWHWEGNVQNALVRHLKSEDWNILSEANTSTKEAGVDVKAIDPEGSEWWITVKGFPQRKAGKTTNPATQARHWFSHAMFDVVMYRTTRSDIKIGVALPGPFPTYQRLAVKSRWLQENAPFTLFLIDGDGQVTSG